MKCIALASFRVFILLLILLQQVHAIFYLPGVAPQEFLYEQKVDLKVNKLTSIHTQLPYKYYSLPFCSPKKIQDKVENLGEILRGDRIENSLYEIQAEVPVSCKVLCVRNYTKSEVKHFSEKVGFEYRVHWVVDNLPAASPKMLQDAKGGTTTVYESSFFLGMKGDGWKKDVNYIHNHHNIKLLYHENPGAYKGIRIVGFEVQPQSIHHSLDFNHENPKAVPTTCEHLEELQHFQELEIPKDSDHLTIVWTYSVAWEASSIPWANRWDRYLFNTDPQIHWFSIINSLMIVLFLTGMVAMIIMRTLRADFIKYNQPDPENEVEETGWKLVHGDVFRPPQHAMLLSVFVGSGVQVFGMTLITLTFAVLGFLSPANRGGLTTAAVLLFVVMGVFAGYSSTTLHRQLKGRAWKKNIVMTAMLFPGIIFSIFLFINFFIAGQKSSGAVPFGTLMSLIALWFGVSVPLVFFGSYFALKKDIPENPIRTNHIPRLVPEQIWYMNPLFSILMGGILPFGAVFIELFFILTAIWGQHFYYIFGFLFMVFTILVVTCAEITIIMCYFQLCSEDYHWWWRSYLTSGASAFYMFLYSIFYFFTKLEIETAVSTLMYFGYSLIMALVFFVLTGTIGFYACHRFVTRIYSAVHFD